jgi:hypothetical protein
MPPPKSPNRRTEQIHIRATRAEKAVLAETARRRGADVGTWLRYLGMKDAEALGLTLGPENPEGDAPAPEPVSGAGGQ